VTHNSLYIDFETDLSKEVIEVELEVAFNSTIIEGDVYDGEYVAKPSFETQTLHTKNKVLTNDVTVNAIEVSRVSNLQGGKTVYIGGIINA